MTTFENQFDDLDNRLASAQKAATTMLAAIRRARAGAQDGRISDVARALPVTRQLAGDLVALADALVDGWRFDAAEYMGTEGYVAELRAAAAEEGLRLFERDGKLYAFPLILRIEARDAAIRIGRKLERRVRPRSLVKLLGEIQKRPQRFKEQQFLEMIYRAYRALGAENWRDIANGPGPVITLGSIHEVLTLLPGSDYLLPEFGRDLLLLDRQPDLATKDGARFEFVSSTIAKERKVAPIVVYDEEGRERRYYGLRFVREG